MLEALAIVIGSIILVLGLMGLIVTSIGAIVLVRLWNRYDMKERFRTLYYQLKWYISGRGTGF